MSAGDLVVVPISLHACRRFVAEHHRHSQPPHGWLFGSAAWSRSADRMVGVACAARPTRNLQDGYTVCLTRVTSDGTPNVCTLLMGSLCRAAKALGYRRAYTYTLDGEDGASLRAAGFTIDGTTRDQDWDRPSRPRKSVVIDLFGEHRTQPEGDKVRWIRRLAPEVPS